jgi:hypothetical protein
MLYGIDAIATSSRSRPSVTSSVSCDDGALALRIRADTISSFSTAETAVRRGQAEDPQQVCRGPTELPKPTEPIPNRSPDDLA